MFEHHIKNMANDIASTLMLGDYGRERIEQTLNAYWKDKLALVWYAEDVQERHPLLNQEEACKVLHEVLDFHDDSQGICWDTIDDVARQLFGDKASDSSDDEGGA